MIIPTLRQLQYLVALGETGSFSRAADACHVTQPTLSAGIKELEDLLGVKLADRQARGARLTHAGQLAIRRASALINDAYAFVEAVQSAGATLTGPFHLGAIPTIAPYVLPDMVRALKQSYPDLKLYLHEDKTARLIDQLRTRRLDAALIALPWDMTGIDSVPLFDDEFLFAAPSSHPLAAKPHLQPEDLAGESILLLEDGHCLRSHALSICRMGGDDETSQMAATSLSTLVSMVAGGHGVSLLPKLAIDHGLSIGEEVALRDFDKPVVGRQIGIAWRSGSPREADARKIGEVVRSLLAKSVPA